MNTIEKIKKSAEEVHNALSSGHTESTYHSALERELSDRGVGFSSEGTIPIFYKESPVGQRRPDMFVESSEGTFVLELKAGSNKGSEQLQSYKSILDNDNNFVINGALLIKFNDELEVIEAKDL